MLIFSWKFEQALGATLLAYSWVFRHAFAATEHLLAFSWASPASSWCYALSCLLELPTRSWCVLSSNTFSLSWDVPARSWRYALGFSWSMARYFCFFLWHIEFQHALDATFLAPALTLSWCYALNLVLEQSKMLLTLRSTTIVMIRSYNFFVELPTRSCWCYAPPLDAAVWRKSRSSCYALSFVLEHARTL